MKVQQLSTPRADVTSGECMPGYGRAKEGDSTFNFTRPQFLIGNQVVLCSNRTKTSKIHK